MADRRDAIDPARRQAAFLAVHGLGHRLARTRPGYRDGLLPIGGAFPVRAGGAGLDGTPGLAPGAPGAAAAGRCMPGAPAGRCSGCARGWTLHTGRSGWPLRRQAFRAGIGAPPGTDGRTGIAGLAAGGAPAGLGAAGTVVAGEAARVELGALAWSCRNGLRRVPQVPQHSGYLPSRRSGTRRRCGRRA